MVHLRLRCMKLHEFCLQTAVSQDSITHLEESDIHPLLHTYSLWMSTIGESRSD